MTVSGQESGALDSVSAGDASGPIDPHPLLRNLPTPVAHCRILCDAGGAPCDLLILQTSLAFARQIERSAASLAGAHLGRLLDPTAGQSTDWPLLLADVARLVPPDGTSERTLRLLGGKRISLTAHYAGRDECTVVLTRLGDTAEQVLREFIQAADRSPDLIAIIDREYRYASVSPGYAAYAGRKAGELAGRPVAEVGGDELFAETLRPLLDRAFSGETVTLLSERFHPPAGSRKYLEGSCLPLPGAQPAQFVAAILRDVSDQVQRDRERTLLVELLRLLDRPSSTEELARDITEVLHTHSGCEAVGLRLSDGTDFPYYETHGFPAEFVLAERHLCARDQAGAVLRDDDGNPLLECMCGNVIRGRFDPSKAFFTESGSFWTNCTTDLLATTTEEDRQSATRNRCNGQGYESVALIPLRSGGETLGLLQFNDRRRGMFSLQYIHALEHLAISLAAGLARRRFEEAKRAADARLASITEHSLDGFVITDTDGTILSWNRAQAEMTGISAAEATGLPLWEVQLRAMLPERRNAISVDRVRQADLEMLRGVDSGERENCSFEWPVVRADGEQRLMQSTMFPVLGERRHLLCTISRDVTEQRRAEEALRESERRYRQLFQQSISGFALHEYLPATDDKPADYRFLEVNTAFERMTGLRREALLGRTVRQVMPGVEPLWIERYGRVATSGEPEQFDGYSADLGRYFEVRAFSPQRGQFAVLFEDVTQRKAAERALQESEERVRRELTAILEPGGESGAPELVDIIDRQAVQSLIGDLCNLTGVAVAMLDQKGEVLVAAGWQDICTQFHRINPEACANCRESDTVLTDGVPSGTYKLYRCKNSMWDLATPIVVGGRRIGNLYVGQFFFDDEVINVEAFRRQAQRYGFDEQAYLAALERVPRLSRHKVDRVMGIYTKLAGMVASLSHSNLRLVRALSERDSLLVEVRRSEERYRVLVENAGQAVFVVQESIIKFANPRATEFIGHSRERLLGAPISEFVHPDDRSLVLGRHRQRLQGSSLPSTYVFRVIHASDEMRWVELSAVLIEWEGKPATLNFLSDITERKRAEEALTAGQQRFRTLAETIPLGIVETDIEGCVEYVSPAYLRVFGLTGKEVVGSLLWELGEDGGALRTYFRRLAHERPAPQPWYGRGRTKNGRLLDLRVDWAYRHNPQDQVDGFITVMTDITSQRQLEAQLLQAQKMESVGRLAGGVAHDFNNLLTAISGYAEFVLEELDPNTRARVDIQEVLRNAERASSLTRQLLAFSRKQTMAMRPVDLNTLIVDLGKLLRRLIGEHIDLVLQPGESLPEVHADPAQLEQVIVNLAVNARDAMPGGGQLTIATSATRLPANVASSRPDLPQGAYALLRVSDTGGGMDAEVLAHLFEPFYTTKAPDKGTGLGLATVYGIVTQHGGHITADSRVGEGSVFSIYLPLVSATKAAGAQQQTGTLHRGSGETILLVEDEPQVRAVERRTLQRLPDLVVTDMVMPKMGGIELATRLRASHPELRYLFTSGYTDDPEALAILSGSSQYLHKPFSAQMLAAAVREALQVPPHHA
ncbi:MAG: PAS domain S-box protein [Anaerolineae bacterium]